MQEDSFTGRIANLVIFRVTEFGFWGQGGTAERLPPKAAVRNCSRDTATTVRLSVPSRANSTNASAR